jgi:acetyl-CoA carboxylase carboxyltransferase component
LAILESKLKRNEAFERQSAHWKAEVEKLRGGEAKIRLGGDLKALDKQRAQGKMTARERVAALCSKTSPGTRSAASRLCAGAFSSSSAAM